MSKSFTEFDIESLSDLKSMQERRLSHIMEKNDIKNLSDIIPNSWYGNNTSHSLTLEPNTLQYLHQSYTAIDDIIASDVTNEFQIEARYVQEALDSIDFDRVDSRHKTNDNRNHDDSHNIFLQSSKKRNDESDLNDIVTGSSPSSAQSNLSESIESLLYTSNVPSSGFFISWLMKMGSLNGRDGIVSDQRTTCVGLDTKTIRDKKASRNASLPATIPTRFIAKECFNMIMTNNNISSYQPMFVCIYDLSRRRALIYRVRSDAIEKRRASSETLLESMKCLLSNVSINDMIKTFVPLE